MKRILSIMLAAALLLAGCAGPGGAEPAKKTVNANAEGGGRPANMSYALSEPVYPEFPKQPQFPEEGGEGAWEAYYDAYEKYVDALAALRGDTPNLTKEDTDTLNAFAARSVPLALAGHEGENAVYSPLSLWSALAMLAQCAEGDSRQQVLDALGADHVESLQEAVSHIWRALYTDDGMSSLILGNSVWLNDAAGGTYVQDTLDTLAQKYYAGTYSVPMGTDEADQAVTKWVSEQTGGLIGGDAPVVQTMPETLALLVSSLYYRAGWKDEFAPALTEEDIFTDAAGQESRVDFMHQTQIDSFLRQEGWQAARLVTNLGYITFVLPDEGVSPESLLQDSDFLSKLDFSTEKAILGEVQWSVPKFDVDSDLNLLDALENLGITDLLAPEKADLSALTNLNAFLSKAKQLARVKVDEEGVEAAAVTILEIDECALMIPEDGKICIMDLDRPFLFVICMQNVPLFVGVVNQV